MNEMIPHWLSKQAYVNPNQIAIEFENGDTFTFLQLKEESERFARKLAGFGVVSGKKLAILSPNRKEMIVAIHAATYLEIMVVFLNIRLTNEELTYQLSHSEVDFLLSTELLLDEKQLSFDHCITFEQVQKQKEKTVTLQSEIALDQPFSMMYTSGTTGKPKAVVHTYGNHWWSAIGSSLNLGIHHDDKWLLVLPLFHVGGLSILFRSVIYGMTVYFMEKYDRKWLFDALIEKDITIASLVTVMLQDVVEQLKDTSLPENVRCILLGGGSVPEQLLKKVEEKSIPLFQSYGMTETSSQIVTLSINDARKKIGSSGKPLLPANVKIVNENEDGIGEIVVKGPMVFNGYYKHDEVNKEVFQNGWFQTGDLGYFDEEGFLYIVDRRKDLIISGGENIYPSEIENVLLQHPVIKEAAVVAKKDERWGHVPVAFVVAKETVCESEIIDFMKRSIATYKVPKQIIFTNELPRNASNKIMRYQLQQQIEK